jgi:hypothetical protein
MRLSKGFAAVAAAIVTGALSAGCQNGVTGPSLVANFHDVSLQPTVAGLEGGANVCCCHLVGRLTNSSSVAVDAELRFPAKDRAGQPVGVGEDLLLSVAPGATKQFLAVGVTAPCSSLTMSQILADGQVRLKGLWQP